MRRAAATVAGLALTGFGFGCGGDGPDPGGVGTVSFTVSNGVRQSAALVDPLMGTVYGNVFLSSEVTLAGPIDGAMEFGAAEVAGIDLVTAMESGAWATPELPPGTYTFLGFFDVDGNGAVSHDPDNGDPVTLPLLNQFTIAGPEGATLVASFDLVYNF